MFCICIWAHHDYEILGNKIACLLINITNTQKSLWIYHAQNFNMNL